MKHTLYTPCPECPFLKKWEKGYTEQRLREFSSGPFPCHKTCEMNEDGEFVATDKSLHCAGALIYREKRDDPNQMMRIAERLGIYDRTKLNMDADVR